MDNEELKKRIEEIVKKYSPRSEDDAYNVGCMENLKEKFYDFIQENFVPKEEDKLKNFRDWQH